MVGKVKKIVFIAGQGILIAFIVILFVCPLSCRLTAEGIDIIKGDYLAPKMSECVVIDDKHVGLNFSEDVTLSSLSISKKDEKSCNDDELFAAESLGFYIANNDNNGKVVIGLDNSTEIGSSYIISGIVEDRTGNSLTFSTPFSGYNGNMPKMIITEVQPESGSVTKAGTAKCEYIELLALEDGNLYGLVLGSATNGEELDYHFPPIEVKKGEVIVVHLRIKGEGCISEDGDNLNLAFSNFCTSGVRDLWLNNTSSALSDSYDAIYLKDSINNKFCDGFMYINKKDKSKWSDEVAKKIDELVCEGIFTSCDIADACDERDVTTTKVFVRTNVADIISNANSAIERGEEIVVPLFNKEHWCVTVADAGKI